jgi:hypothetical protein
MAALRRLNRKQRRAGAELLTGSRAYIRAAAESLGFSDEQLAEAQSGQGESADMLMARVFELLELQHGHSTPDCDQARAELEQRRGAGFVQRVARMGKPASVALRALLATLALFVLSLFSSRVEAATAKLAPLRSAHKIQRRNSAGLLAIVRKFADNLRRWGWIRSKKYYATSRRPSPSCPALGTGCAAGRESSRRPARRTRSLWCGGSAAFASGDSPPPNPTSLSNVLTARLSARRGASRAKGGSANANA